MSGRGALALTATSGLHSTEVKKENWRTCGRWAPPKQNLLRKQNRTGSVPSIPSRIETTLIKGDRETLGFGSNSLRFDGGRSGAQPEDFPAPGQYSVQKTFHQEVSDRAGWGIRGTGGFASRSRRFGARSLPSLPRPGLGCPGPGAYNEMTALSTIQKPRDFNQAKTTAVFADHLEKRDVEMVPGPGHYSTIAKSDDRERAAAESAFRSKTGREVGGISASTEETPGPGKYFDVEKADKNTLLDNGHAVFRDPIKRPVFKVHPDLPAAEEQKTREALGAFAEQVGRECAGIERSLQKPGPGHYDQDRDVLWQSTFIAASGSSSFQAGAERHDWTGGEAKVVPGPGKYDPRKAVPDRLTSAVSAFNSMTDRNQLPVGPAPGPAYYTPSLMDPTKSFMLNAKRQWIG